MVDESQTAYISHPDCLKHDMGSYHPESPQRLAAIENQLLASGLLSQLQLCDDDYVWVTQQIKEMAGKHAYGRIVSVLEGGYELNVLGRCVTAHLKVLSGY